MDLHAVCVVCLADTNLLPLGMLEKLYRLLGDTNKFMGNELFTCATCHNFFNKIQEFQQKIQNAQDILMSNNSLKNTVTTELRDDLVIKCEFDDDCDNEYINNVKEIKTEIVEDNTDVCMNSLKSATHENYSVSDLKCEVKIEQLSDECTSDKHQWSDNVSNQISEVKTEKLSEHNAKCQFPEDNDQNSRVKKDKLSGKRNAKRQFSEVSDQNSEMETEKLSGKRTNAKRRWSDKDIDDYIEKQQLPYNRKYVRELLEYRNMNYKVVSGVELYRNEFDSVVEKHVGVDVNEMRELMEQSRDRQFCAKRNRCDKCVLNFKSINLLQDHITKKHVKYIGPHECDICETRTKSKKAMVTHIRSHGTKYVCKICRHVTCNKQLIYDHLRRKMKLFQCPQCKQIFESLTMFYQHYRSMHRHFICDYCKKTYQDKLWFEKHVVHSHMPNKCKQCPKVFPDNRKLLAHMRFRHLVETDAERTYCADCDRHFKNHAKLRQHLYSPQHKQKRPRHPCQECGASFLCKDYLNKHINHVHNNQGEKCAKCSKIFMDKVSLKAHMLSVHEKVKRPRNKICSYCGKAFDKNLTLMYHIRTHTGERPHRCRCGAAFGHPSALKSHVASQQKKALGDIIHEVVPEEEAKGASEVNKVASEVTQVKTE